jgi:hypothetical protein
MDYFCDFKTNGQAQRTLFTILLPKFINWEASPSISNLILDGDFTYNELSDLKNLVLKHCHHTTTLDAIYGEITKDDQFISLIKVRQKSTTAPPLNILKHVSFKK